MRFLGCWVPEELYEAVVKYQRRHFMTRSELIRAALRRLILEEVKVKGEAPRSQD